MRYAVTIMAALYIQIVFREELRILPSISNCIVVTNRQRICSSSLNTAQISIGIHLMSHLNSQLVSLLYLKYQLSIGITLIFQISTLSWCHLTCRKFVSIDR